MAIYDFKCKKCDHQYDIWAPMQEKDETVKKEKCPECGSKSKEEYFHAPSFTFEGEAVVGTDRWHSGTSGHDYRHKYNVDRPGGVRDQREYAEENSHMGSDPYPEIDDINNGKSFGKPVDSDGPIRLS
jgi:putative FmdB family regulatory protein